MPVLSKTAAPGRQTHLFYRGPSMDGTLRPGDRLRLEYVPLPRVRRGDVVVFAGPGRKEDELVVHRVVGRGPAGLVTRGDNNSTNDPDPLTSGNYIGTAVEFERGAGTRRLRGGRPGMLRARALRARLRALAAARRLLGRPYRALKRSGIAEKIWRPRIETIRFETAAGPLVKYVHKGRTVAACWTASGRWWFKRPYDLVLGPGSRRQ